MKKCVKPLITVLLVVALLVPTVAMLYSSAAQSYTVELAFENLFVLEQWASNEASTYVRSDGSGGSSDGSLDVNIENGSFRLTNKTTTTNVYTTASMTNKDNIGFYSMPVEENCTYSLSYNVTGSNLAGFFPFVFFYYGASKEPTFQNGAASNLNGDNSYIFTVPAGATHIQLRFQMPCNPSATSYADVKNIAIYKVDTVIDPTNLFDFATWSTKPDSGGDVTPAFGVGGTSAITANEQSLTLTSHGTGNLGDCSAVLTNFSLGEFDNNSFTIDTEPGKTYSLSYNLTATTLASTTNLMVLIPWYKSDNSWRGDYGEHGSLASGNNTYSFTVPEGIYHFQIVFGLYDYSNTNGVYATVKDIELHEVTTVEHKANPTRKIYTYTGGGETYGTLSTPSAATIPEGYIFAGWYTGKDGTGIRIAADTPIQPMSYTVYPKFEPSVDSLSVVAMPAKTEYTKGEKLNTTGLVLQATIKGKGDTDSDGIVDSPDTTFNITSGYYCTPAYLTATGTQTITANYGGKTATFTVNVSNGKEKNIVVNGDTYPVMVANNEYTLDYQADSPFNRYEMTYFSDSYVKGEIVMDGISEEFFLEPSDNGSFASYIDSFLRGIKHYGVASIKFTCLDKEYGNFELLSLTTLDAAVPGESLQFYNNDEYKVGIDLAYGGVVSYIEDLRDTGKGKVTAAVYTENGKDITRVDYASNLPSGAKLTSASVNLINTNDRGRYLQQSYYGTADKPYEMGDYNGNPWNYNPVQGGNLQVQDANGNVIKGNESSKVIDYRITNDQIYVKSRPLDWGKNSVDYPDSYVTDSYMEAWYVFEDGMIKTYCRFVDYSGYPSNTTTQEMPALYTIEPLNHFVYNDVEAGKEWSTKNFKNIEEPDFWGVLPEYNALLEEKNKSDEKVKPDVIAKENWAAFTAGEESDSFGIGVYSPGVEDMHYGTFPAKYNEEEVKKGNLVNNYRHAASLDPAIESPTSYISPVDVYTFESFSPKTYSFYITTGTADEIYNDFKTVANKDNQADLDKTKIAVPETVYMTPANGASKVGQYYVNNIMDESLNNKVVTEAKRDAGMYLGLSIKDAKEFSVKVTNVTDPDNDIFLCNTSGSEISESTRIQFGAAGIFKDNTQYGLRFSGDGLEPGEKATAKWEITVYKNDGTSEVFTAYTVMYAPGRTVGAVAEARQVDDSQNEISSWITGANGVDHTKQAPLGSLHADYRSFGYFKYDPLYNEKAPSGGSGGTSNDYIEVGDNENDYYVMQAATNGHDGSRAQSYLGLLTVDKSRYTNTNQIPNLEIGFDALRVGDWKKDSLDAYKAYYTLGTSEAFTATDLNATPSGWTQVINAKEYADSHTLPYRETFIPEYNVSDIDGKYIHALNQGAAYQTWIATRYSTAGTSVLCSVTDKSELRDSVLNGYTIVEDDPEFIEALEKAATVLGDPSATQPEIDEAKKELNDITDKLLNVYYALKYDNLFSAYEFSQHSVNMTTNVANATVKYENASITVNSNGTEKADVYTSYNYSDNSYLTTLEPNTAYVYEYDVVSDKGSQAFIFFYDAATGAGIQVTDRSIQIGSGAPSLNTETVPHFGSYTHGVTDNHYVMRFTTPDKPIKVGFRFGNVDDTTAQSTFSNIRLIDAARYYADVEYPKTEDVYKEYSSYGILPTLTRTGYTFGGWKDAEGKTVTGADIATEHKSIFSVWTENKYTIVYNANGGSGSIASQTVTYTQSVTLDSGSNFSKSGYTFVGWATTSNATSAQYKPGQIVSGLTDVKDGTVTLYAVWIVSEINVTFDNLVDFKAWNKTTANNGKISDITDTGFTITTNTGAGEGTSESPEFPVTGGKQYMIDADFVGDGWDVYIFFRNATVGGTGIDFDDGTNRFSSNGSGNPSQIFTAPANATKAVIRLDSNGSGNIVSYNNIRVYEYDGISPIEVETSNKIVTGGNTFGDLPTPTKEGFSFLGWFDENDNQVTANSTVPNDPDGLVRLTSKWQLADTALGKDSAVVDFGTPISIAAVSNDTVFTKAATAYNATASIVGVSTDGGSYSSSVNGRYGTFKVENGAVTYTPTAIVNGVENVYYHAQLSAGDETVIKSEIKVVPASNVLYEENILNVNTPSTLAWTTVGTAGTENQNASTDNDLYGYDTSYNKIADYSNGSALKVTVNAAQNRSDTQKFTFKGTGFDLIGSCGKTTGVQIVTIRNSANELVKVFMVDTYYNDSNILTSGNLNQIPIVSFTGNYDVYSVEVTAAYISSANALKQSAVETYAINGTEIEADSAVLENNDVIAAMLAEIGMEELANEEIEVIWMDDNSVLNGGTGAEAAEGEVSMYALTYLDNYIDGIRVYNPIEDHSEYNQKEQGAVYYNVMNNLADTENGIFTELGGIFAYIEGSISGGSSFADYINKGPKNELYLSNYKSEDGSSGVTFKVNLPEGARVMISARAAVGSPNFTVNGKAIILKSSTEMFYDITDYVKEANGVVAITNTGNGLLALSNMKLVGATTASVSTYSLDEAVALMSLEPVEVEYTIPTISQPETDTDGDSDNDVTTDWIEIVISKICSFFSNIFGYIKRFFEIIISFFTAKEVL